MAIQKPSRARDLFNEILSAGTGNGNQSDDAARSAYLRAMVNSNPPTYETEFLDFIGKPAKDDDLKSNWGKALSGFANTEGGVIVWGIKATSDDATDIDSANGLELMQDPEKVKNRLKELLRKRMDPPLPGVEIVAIIDSPTPPQGFVVCLIPEGDFKPYRAELVKNKPYMERAQDGFFVLNRSKLASMFYPRTRPHLKAKASISWTRQDVSFQGHARFTCRLFVHNEGPASAKETMIKVEITPFNFDSFSALHGIHWYTDTPPDFTGNFYASNSIHPKIPQNAANFVWMCRLTTAYFDNFPNSPPIRINVTLAAENCEPFEYLILFDPKTIPADQEVEVEGVRVEIDQPEGDGETRLS